MPIDPISIAGAALAGVALVLGWAGRRAAQKAEAEAESRSFAGLGEALADPGP